MHDRRTLIERLIGWRMEDGECGAFLSQDNPAPYDATI
jgi:hypothetical protein